MAYVLLAVAIARWLERGVRAIRMKAQPIPENQP